MDELSSAINFSDSVSSIPSLALNFDKLKVTLKSFDLYSSFCTLLSDFLENNGFDILDFFEEV